MKDWLSNWYISCGSGLYSLMDLFALLSILFIIWIAAYFVKKYIKNKYYCMICGEKIKKEWVLCPYCGNILKR